MVNIGTLPILQSRTRRVEVKQTIRDLKRIPLGLFLWRKGIGILCLECHSPRCRDFSSTKKAFGEFRIEGHHTVRTGLDNGIGNCKDILS
jgi:hypothetical protein